MEILKEVQKYQDFMVQERRYFHTHPELSGLEDNTIAHIKAFLEETGVYYEEVPDGGILAFIKGPAEGKTVLLRADCDALPILEDVNNTAGPRSCISENPGVCHACGHDAHTAMLMGAARVLNEHREEIKGTVILMFERGEENTENVLKIYRYTETHNIHIDSSYGLHVDNDLPVGKIAVNAGPGNAGSFTFDLVIHGHGGHGSRPDLANSPIECFTAVYQALSAIRLRKIDPFKALTFSIGCVQAGSASNAIPMELRFKGTSRFHDFNAGKTFKENMILILNQLCPVYDCTWDGYMGGINRNLYNNPDCAELARKVIGEAVGAERITSVPPRMGSETMARTVLKWPGEFARLGTANAEKGATGKTHTPEFDLDEDAMQYGAASHVAYALGFLNSDLDVSDAAYKGSFAQMAIEEGAKQERIDYFLGKTDDLVLLST